MAALSHVECPRAYKRRGMESVLRAKRENIEEHRHILEEKFMLMLRVGRAERRRKKEQQV
jgi:hypothetical protein